MIQLVAGLGRALQRFYGRRSPALVVTLILAPAVGLTASVSNLVARMMFRDAPGVEAPGRLVEIGGLEYSDYDSFARSARTMDVAAFATTKVDLPDNAGTIRLGCVTQNFFTVLGVRAAIGRTFVQKEGDDAQVTVLGDGLWHRLFGRDPAAVGRALVMNRRTYAVIGVASAGFRGLGVEPVDAWIPFVAGGETCSYFGSLGTPRVASVGRLRGQFSVENAASEWSAFESITPAQHRTVEALAATERWRIQRDKDVLIWLGAGSILVLLVACTNAAALFAMTAMKRRREIAVRYCLGASRLKIAGLLLAESLSAATLCALTAWMTARSADSVMNRYYRLPQSGFLDARLLLLAGLFAVLASLASGVLPAFRASRRDFLTLLKADSLGVDSRRRSRQFVLVGQVAIAFALLLMAGLFWRSTANLQTGLGYNIESAICVRLDPNRSAYDDDENLQPARDLVYRELQRHPRVAAVALANYAPLAGGHFTMGRAEPGGRPAMIGMYLVSPEYLKAVGGTLLKGRNLAGYDVRGSLPVALVSDTLARELWATTDAVGRCIFIGQRAECTQVVGVVRGMRQREIEKPLAAAFVPLTQCALYPSPFLGRSLLVRLRDSRNGIEVIQQAVKAAAPGLPADVVSLTTLTDPFTRSWRLGATTFGLVGALTFVLAVFGVYCALSLLVRQRTPEIGVRVALGATRGRIFGMTVAQGLSPLSAGWVLGTGLAVGLARLIQNLLFGVGGLDVTTFIVGSAGLYLVGLLACILPSWRAARLDALVAMRAE
jgi:predicted permease